MCIERYVEVLSALVLYAESLQNTRARIWDISVTTLIAKVGR